jgi:hypothetical protein
LHQSFLFRFLLNFFFFLSFFFSFFLFIELFVYFSSFCVLYHSAFLPQHGHHAPRPVITMKMGSWVEYTVHELRVPACHTAAALLAINTLHAGTACDHFPWVQAPEDPLLGFPSLEDAFHAWAIVDDDVLNEADAAGDHVLRGHYASNLGAQTVLLSTLAPYVENLYVRVVCSRGVRWWLVVDGVFREVWEEELSSAETAAAEEWERDHAMPHPKARHAIVFG